MTRVFTCSRWIRASTPAARNYTVKFDGERSDACKGAIPAKIGDLRPRVVSPARLPRAGLHSLLPKLHLITPLIKANRNERQRPFHYPELTAVNRR